MKRIKPIFVDSPKCVCWIFCRICCYGFELLYPVKKYTEHLFFSLMAAHSCAYFSIMKKSRNQRKRNALLGLFIGDALAMPVHWYYNTSRLREDYGEVRDYLEPKNPHPDSILWRSSYTPPGPDADILHNQKKYWGKKNIHYHQFLCAGENTLNLKLARQLCLAIIEHNNYSQKIWLKKMISFLITPGNHKDTYVEEYLRYYFSRYGKGIKPEQCGRNDEKHIGGYALMLPLIIASGDKDYAVETALQHLSLTHGGPKMARWGRVISLTLLSIFEGFNLKEALQEALVKSGTDLHYDDLEALTMYPDEVVVCKHFSSACYVDLAVPATLFLAVKYQDRPEEGLISNTMCGGDNCGRGAVLGAILGALHGDGSWPDRWTDNLYEPLEEIIAQLKL